MLGTAPLSNSWIIIRIWLLIALNRTANIDCYWMGAVPNLNPSKSCEAKELPEVPRVDWTEVDL